MAVVYLKHFGLVEAPFSITPDTSFAYTLLHHQEALNTLLMALDAGEGFVKVTGEVGSGKTLLCRKLLQMLGDEKWVTAYLPNPNIEAPMLFMALAEELKLNNLDQDQYHLIRGINRALLDHARAGKRVVLCIDEAQAIPMETLESVRLLSNLETEKRKLLQIVLFGQPELDEKLSRPEVRQLLQRIAFHYRLDGVRKDEIGEYISHRLRVAGYRGDALFSQSALKLLYRAGRGTPRLINILAHKSLMAVFGEGRMQVKTKHVRLACKDTEGVRRLVWPFI